MELTSHQSQLSDQPTPSPTPLTTPYTITQKPKGGHHNFPSRPIPLTRATGETDPTAPTTPDPPIRPIPVPAPTIIGQYVIQEHYHGKWRDRGFVQGRQPCYPPEKREYCEQRVAWLNYHHQPTLHRLVFRITTTYVQEEVIDPMAMGYNDHEKTYHALTAFVTNPQYKPQL